MSTAKWTVLAVGAAGEFARLVVPELAKRGTKVCGFVRSPDEINAEPWSADTRFSRVDYRDVAEVAAMMGATLGRALLGREPRTLRAYLAELATGRVAH